MPKKAKTRSKPTKAKVVKKTSVTKEEPEEIVTPVVEPETTPAPDATDTVIPAPQSVIPTPQTPTSETSIQTPPIDIVPPVAVLPSVLQQTPPVADPLSAGPAQIISTNGQVLPASESMQAPQVQQPAITPIQAPPTDSSAVASQLPPAPSSFQLDDSDGGGNKKNIFLMILLILIIAALIGIGFVYRQPIMSAVSGKLNSAPTPTSTAAPSQQSATPTPTPKTVKLDIHPIEVLNGSGTAGEASKVKEILVGKGFKVDSVGNADSSDHTNTVIQAKSSVSRDFLDSLKKTLSESYTLDPVDTLSETKDVDIIVVIGQTKAK